MRRHQSNGIIPASMQLVGLQVESCKGRQTLLSKVQGIGKSKGKGRLRARQGQHQGQGQVGGRRLGVSIGGLRCEQQAVSEMMPQSSVCAFDC